MKAVCVILAILFINLICAQNQYADFKASVLENGERARAYVASGFPAINPRIGTLTGVDASTQRTTAGGSANLDVSYFILNTFSQVSYGYAYFHAQASVPDASSSQGQFVGNFSAAGFALGIRFHGLVEYVETNNIPGAQPNDTFTGNGYNLNSLLLPWKPWTIEQANITKDIVMFTVTAQTEDDVFLIRVRAVSYPIVDTANDIRINPDASKVDIEVRYYDNAKYTRGSLYATGPSDASKYPNAQIALVSTVGAAGASYKYDTSTKVGPGNGASVTLAAAGGFTGFFNWETQANTRISGVAAAKSVHVSTEYTGLNAADTTVQQSFQSGWAGSVLVFAYEGSRPSEIIWDPKIGSQNPYTSNGGSSGAATFSMVSFALVALIALLF